jgi:transposase
LFKPLLPLVPAGLVVDRLLPGPDRVILLARPRSPEARCPSCDRPSARVHSTYLRRLADLPWHGRVVELRVRVRRLRCVGTACRRSIFAERLPQVAAVRARRTSRRRDTERHIGLALGGEPGSRLAAKLAMPVSGDTLLRLVRAAGAEPAMAPRVRVLGVDDWAWRRGQRYGTILCDLERRRVVDLLPDRTGEALAAWLKRHPGVEVVARDRAGAYADGIRTGAPDAVQVADRWHLLRNCADALQQVLDRRHRLLREAGRRVAADLAEALPPPAPKPPTKVERGQRERYAKRRDRFDEIVRLRREGLTLQAIADRLQTGRSTVRRWLRRGHAPSWRKGRRASIVDPHADYLRRRLGEGCGNATQLWREIRARGFAGGAVVVRAYVARLKAAGPGAASAASPAPRTRPPWRVPSARQAARLLMVEPADLAAPDRAFLAALADRAPEIREAGGAARAFAALVKARDAAALDPWLAAAAGGPLAGFAEGLRRDLAAVRAALALPWSTGPVEGQVNRLKLLKRQMYGRAGLDLLRGRLLAAA